MNLYSLYCGPCDVSTLANVLRAKGYHVTCEGTAKVYVQTKLSAFDLYYSLKPDYGLLPTDVRLLKRSFAEGGGK